MQRSLLILWIFSDVQALIIHVGASKMCLFYWSFLISQNFITSTGELLNLRPRGHIRTTFDWHLKHKENDQMLKKRRALKIQALQGFREASSGYKVWSVWRVQPLYRTREHHCCFTAGRRCTRWTEMHFMKSSQQAIEQPGCLFLLLTLSCCSLFRRWWIYDTVLIVTLRVGDTFIWKFHVHLSLYLWSYKWSKITETNQVKLKAPHISSLACTWRLSEYSQYEGKILHGFIKNTNVIQLLRRGSSRRHWLNFYGMPSFPERFEYKNRKESWETP